MANKNITVSLDEDLIRNIKLIAVKTDRTQKDIITEFLNDGVDKNRDKL